MTIYYILLSAILGTYVFLGLYLNYMTIRDDIRREKERKAEKKRQDNNSTPLHRSR
ncbi:TPA: hypothetical protein TUW63_000805 [Streptococcus equi subsp. zooepidemicus]|uniref:Uncharacterized protein n=1 Tax=Streptococcus agalactiae TaxID=1311 RepID=A0A8B4RHE2_STRAG|nr:MULTISPECIES: hypothetical protein [Streptococcus]MCD3459503.1 hypothetical protein [Streptococcus equi subsp. zooepidemicus]MDI5902074.1 hypothetical protein [Streptococcus equi subsp. zooepidemicus]MDI5930778.1 hypothetical protein [Streptococcus equi subsp. zooepidemicus]MDI6030047.1 hypothetical protein [Streptococcus equi subsp. zooepidemicus]QKG75320.1 hypothetical protein GE022_003285 [Streptococcus canis]